MRALGCMGRAMVMHELAHGTGMPVALSYADAQKATAAMMKRNAAARAPPFHPCHPFPFSGRTEHTAPTVALSPDRLTATKTADSFSLGWAWARSERGVGAGCGVVRWAVQLSQESGGQVFMVGVASDAFRGYFAEYPPKELWFFITLYQFCTVMKAKVLTR